MKALMLPDAGPRVGLGHVSRLLSVSQALRLSGVKVDFSVRDKTAALLIRQHGFPIKSDWPASDVAVVDSYRFKSSDRIQLKTQARRIAYVDDFGRKAAGFDFVIRGTDYIPLRREFWKTPAPALRPRIRRVLISLGTSPKWEILEHVLRMVRTALPKADLWVPTTYAKADFDLLAALHVHAFPRRARMSSIYRKVDLAISAGGQTALELLSMGIPTIALEVADNQRRQIHFIQRAKAIIHAGSVQAPGLESRLLRAIQSVSGLAERRRLSQNARRRVRGNGALRLGEALIRLSRQKTVNV